MAERRVRSGDTLKDPKFLVGIFLNIVTILGGTYVASVVRATKQDVVVNQIREDVSQMRIVQTAQNAEIKGQVAQITAAVQSLTVSNTSVQTRQDSTQRDVDDLKRQKENLEAHISALEVRLARVEGRGVK